MIWINKHECLRPIKKNKKNIETITQQKTKLKKKPPKNNDTEQERKETLPKSQKITHDISSTYRNPLPQTQPTSHTVHTTTKTTTTKSTITNISQAHNNSHTPSTTPNIITPPLKPPNNVICKVPATLNNTNTKPNPPTNTLKKVDNKELEAKVQEKMEAVQRWQSKCSDLRRQLADATGELSQALEELDHANSLYETSDD